MDVSTTAVVPGGAALGRAPDGRVVLVDGALPDERVQVTIRSERRDVLHADVAEVLEPSPDRVVPPCVHQREGCGGCPWQHVAPAAQPQHKRALIEDALRRIAHLPDAPFEPTVTLPVDAYRTTVRALVIDGRPAFRRRHGHDAVPVERCLVAHPLVDDILQHGHFGKAREITVRAAAATGERLVLADPERTRISVADDVRVGRRAYVTEIVGGREFRVSARSFFQTRPDGAAALATLVRAAVGPGRSVADLYAGVGLFGALLDTPRALVSVERSGPATRDARHNLAHLDARIVRADVEHFRPPEPVEVVIADPSRSGLGREGVRVVAACEPGRVVLVSCDAAALARDIQLLDREGYTVSAITPVDLFGHTPHIECVSVLDKR
jgi:23S rRNA (uracil1939-C5)-methyltransferase